MHAELRRCSAPLELTLAAVTPVADSHGRLARLDVGARLDLAWTWEGALVQDALGAEGHVVAVDADAGALFVDSDVLLQAGPGRAWPFGFLRPLHLLLSADPDLPRLPDLGPALAAAAGLVRGVPLADASAPHPRLGAAWRSSWGVLWGPPGTGKTQLLAAQVAQALADDPSERVLVVSTTNRATDEVALRLGDELLARDGVLHGALRLGPGADVRSFAARGLAELLVGGESELRWTLSALRDERAATTDPAALARIGQREHQVRRGLAESPALWTDPGVRAVVATASSAVGQLTRNADLRALAAEGRAAFTTVILDEAGLVSRARAATLAMLASRRVLLVGDPRQLAPIARMARVLPPDEARWLASSALSHLTPRDAARPDVTLLTEQHRMAPAIRAVVSRYQYGDSLRDGVGVTGRAPWPHARDDLPRAAWYVLDEDAGDDRSAIRGQRGSGGRSWMRRRSLEVIERLVSAFPDVDSGLVVTPYRAQVRAARELLADRPGWDASTVHAQQGAQADLVLVDTVHASSTTWPLDEWQRLVNVALSRAREQVVVLATRDEMSEPFLRPLVASLAPRVLRRGRFVPVEARVRHEESARTRAAAPHSLGAQIEERRTLRPILSAEQERLAAYRLDGKPRLVRGVAGSGKTLVLARWMARVLVRDEEQQAWLVFGNASLRGLLMDHLQEAWRELAPLLPLPTERFELLHVHDVLTALAREAGVPADAGWDPDRLARRIERSGARLPPRCGALFVDEAQDLGPATMRLLAKLVVPRPEGRPVLVFWDNAQNVYGRGVPNWAELGLGMVGRSVVMKESFRGTRPIMELALNALARLVDLESDPDHRELLRRGLLERTEVPGGAVWRVLHCHVEGPPPEVEWYGSREEERAATVERVRRWIAEDGVRPGDIRVLANGAAVRASFTADLQAGLSDLGARVEEQTRRTFTRADDVVVVTTPHSFKGYEAEVVVVPAVDRYVGTNHEPLGPALYVAMTRARSVLRVSGLRAPTGEGAKAVVRAVRGSALG